jgi:hypothetical protein
MVSNLTSSTSSVIFYNIVSDIVEITVDVYDVRLDVIVIAEEALMADYRETAQERIEELRAFRERIPRFAIPPRHAARRALVRVSSLPPEFIEGTAVAMKNNAELSPSGEGGGPEEIRDLMRYAEAYEPVAAEVEALAHFLRYSIALARSKAGHAALTTYALARVLAKRPEHAHLGQVVEHLRRNLGTRRKSKAEPPPEEDPV